MTKEEKEAIEKLTNGEKIDFNTLVRKFKSEGIENFVATKKKYVETVLNMLKEKDKKIEKVLELIFQYGQIDGDHHKTWVIDQIVRILTGEKYNEFVKEYETDEETGEKEWTWENGIAP